MEIIWAFSPTIILIRGKGHEWGDVINFDGPNSGPVREFFITNGRYWIEEFHLDGFRFDATHAIRDESEEYIIGAIGRAAREAAGSRSIILIAENDLQESKMTRPQNEGGDGLDGMWNDDFHHSAIVALTGQNIGYFGDYSGQTAGIYFRCEIRFPVSGAGAFVAKSIARHSYVRHSRGGVLLFHRKSRSDREHRLR